MGIAEATPGQWGPPLGATRASNGGPRCPSSSYLSSMKQLLTLVFLLLASQSQAQSPDPFDRLHEVRSPDSLARITSDMQRIDQARGEEHPAAYFSQGRYRLLYYHTCGWNEVLSHPRTTSDRKFSSDAAGKLFTSREIFRLLSLYGKDSTVLRQYPLVMAREDYYNRRWTPVSSSPHYLVLRYVHSYPNGNMTSWYNEARYYFERVD